MAGLNNQSYLFECYIYLQKKHMVRFEVIRRPTNDETNKDKDNKQTKIVRGSHNTYIILQVEPYDYLTSLHG